MKALSVKQPWANMIAEGEKTIETRTWSTDYRGEILIVSARDPDIPPAGCAVAARPFAAPPVPRAGGFKIKNGAPISPPEYLAPYRDRRAVHVNDIFVNRRASLGFIVYRQYPAVRGRVP